MPSKQVRFTESPINLVAPKTASVLRLSRTRIDWQSGKAIHHFADENGVEKKRPIHQSTSDFLAALVSTADPEGAILQSLVDAKALTDVDDGFTEAGTVEDIT
jgi:hypothetical protein